jgi:hypothetical protein
MNSIIGPKAFSAKAPVIKAGVIIAFSWNKANNRNGMVR